MLVGGEVVGWLGEVHPRVLDAFEAHGPVDAFELRLAPLVRAAVDVKPFADIPRFPAVELDVALVVAEDVTAERVEQAHPFGRRQAARVGAALRRLPRQPGRRSEGKKSMAFSLTYRAPDRTLTDEEVRPVHEKLVRKVAARSGGELRVVDAYGRQRERAFGA